MKRISLLLIALTLALSCASQRVHYTDDSVKYNVIAKPVSEMTDAELRKAATDYYTAKPSIEISEKDNRITVVSKLGEREFKRTVVRQDQKPSWTWREIVSGATALMLCAEILILIIRRGK